MTKATDNDIAALIEAAGSRSDTVRRKALELGLIKAPAAPKAKKESEPKRATSRNRPGPNVVAEGADAETEDDDDES